MARPTFNVQVDRGDMSYEAYGHDDWRPTALKLYNAHFRPTGRVRVLVNEQHTGTSETHDTYHVVYGFYSKAERRFIEDDMVVVHVAKQPRED